MTTLDLVYVFLVLYIGKKQNNAEIEEFIVVLFAFVLHIV